MVCSSHREFFHLENVPWLPIAVGVEGGEAAKWSATGDDRSDTPGVTISPRPRLPRFEHNPAK